MTGVTTTVTIVEPAGNVAPMAVNNPPSCVSLVCNFSAVGSADPNTGDTHLATGGTSATVIRPARRAPSRTFPAPGTYEVVVTVTDGWGRSSTASHPSGHGQRELMSSGRADFEPTVNADGIV